MAQTLDDHQPLRPAPPVGTPAEPRRRHRLKPWRSLGWGGRLWRVVWVTAASLWLLSVVQVLLGIVINPPLTPLMVTRLVQQLADDGRPVRLERSYVPLDDISPNLVTAVVHSEDGLFLYHKGFDVKQMKAAVEENQRAAVSSQRSAVSGQQAAGGGQRAAGGSQRSAVSGQQAAGGGQRAAPVRGGSTISQQTAKNAFLPHSRTLLRKAAEAYYTILIEKLWGKRRIMEVYLNIIEFGDGIYGAEAAAQHYFGHSAKSLTRSEAAQLAATLPAPLLRNPALATPRFRRRAANIERRFAWGMVDIDHPDPKKQQKYQGQESLLDFVKWYIANRRKNNDKPTP